MKNGAFNRVILILIQLTSFGVSVIATVALIGHYVEREMMYRWMPLQGNYGMDIPTAISFLSLSLCICLLARIRELIEFGPIRQ